MSMNPSDVFRAHVRLEEMRERFDGHTERMSTEIKMLLALGNEAPSRELLDLVETLQNYSEGLRHQLEKAHERFYDELGGDVAFMNEEFD